jgi:hypothetical protein
MNSSSPTSTAVSTSSSSKTSLYRNELLNGDFAAIDIEYYKNDNNSEDQKSKPLYTIFAVSIVDSLGNVKAKHIFDFADEELPEKALVEWTMREILSYNLTIGWYTRGVEIIDEEE